MGWRDACPCLWPRPLVSTFSVKAENERAVQAGRGDGLHRAVKVCEGDRGTKKETIDPKRRQLKYCTLGGHQPEAPGLDHPTQTTCTDTASRGTASTRVASRPWLSALGSPRSGGAIVPILETSGTPGLAPPLRTGGATTVYVK